MMERILIKDALVYDPETHTHEIRPVAAADGKLADPEGFVPDVVIDGRDTIVTPGLIDFHLHCYVEGSDGASEADTFCLPNGVTTCIDAGTAGSANFHGLYSSSMVRSKTRVLALLHVAPEGLTTGHHGENQTPADWDVESIRSLCEKYPEIVGIKVRQGANINDRYGLHDEPLIEAVKLAGELGKKVVVHVNNPNVDCETIASELRPGDVYCHMYAGRDVNILNAEGRVLDGVKKARERGVLFDACNGRGNFLFDVAESAIGDGFFPDIISSDNTPFTNYKQPLISLPRLLSKYLMFGMDLYDVFDTATITPAKWIGRPELASMKIGTPADLAIWKLKEKKVSFRDFSGAERMGTQVLVPQFTLRDGEIVYAQADFL